MSQEPVCLWLAVIQNLTVTWRNIGEIIRTLKLQISTLSTKYPTLCNIDDHEFDQGRKCLEARRKQLKKACKGTKKKNVSFNLIHSVQKIFNGLLKKVTKCLNNKT